MSMAITMIAMAIDPAGSPSEPEVAAAGCNRASAITRAVAIARLFMLIVLSHTGLGWGSLLDLVAVRPSENGAHTGSSVRLCFFRFRGDTPPLQEALLTHAQ